MTESGSCCDPHGEGPAPGPFSALLGFRYLSVDESESVVEADPGPEHCNGGGIVHGGFLASLLDTATGWAVHARVPAGQLRRTCTSASSTSGRRCRGRPRLPSPMRQRRWTNRFDRGRAHPAWGCGGPGSRYPRRSGSLRPLISYFPGRAAPVAVHLVPGGAAVPPPPWRPSHCPGPRGARDRIRSAGEGITIDPDRWNRRSDRGKFNREGASLARAARDLDGSVHHLHEVCADCQPEAGASCARASSRRRAD